MKTILFYKQFDFWLQILAVAIPAITAMFTGVAYYCIYAYVFLGMVQVISCFVNGFILEYYQKHKSRIVYQYVLATITVLVATVSIFDTDNGKQFIFYTLMVVAPFIAAWYMWFSYKETKFARSLVNRDQFVKI